MVGEVYFVLGVHLHEDQEGLPEAAHGEVVYAEVKRVGTCARRIRLIRIGSCCK